MTVVFKLVGIKDLFLQIFFLSQNSLEFRRDGSGL